MESCRKSLQAMEPVWPGSRKLKELLNDVEKRAKEVVVTADPARLGKKRKPSAQDAVKRLVNVSDHARGNIRSPSTLQYTSPSQLGSRPSPEKGDGIKRPRGERYATSDTRTLVRDEVSSLNHQPLHSIYPTQNIYPTPTVDSLITPQQATFDVGGVTFDGLDMLQGFTSNDSTNFWDSFLNPQFIATPNMSTLPQLPQGGYIPSIQSTPTSTPGVTAGMNMGNGQGNGEVNSEMGWNMGSTVGLDGMEFWSQVGEGRFDWGADPSVPFNV